MCFKYYVVYVYYYMVVVDNVLYRVYFECYDMVFGGVFCIKVMCELGVYNLMEILCRKWVIL